MLDPDKHALWHAGMSMHRFFLNADPAKFLVEGHGCRVRDAAGRWYLDARSSLWNVSLGYGHPKLTAAIQQQLETLPFAQSIRYDRASDVAVEFATKLVAQLPPSLTRVRFGNTGSQVTSAAVLLSRYLRIMDGQPDRTAVVALANSWHGTGGLASRLTGEPHIHHLQNPLAPDVHHAARPECPHGTDQPHGEDCAQRCAQHVFDVLDQLGPDRVTAVIMEPLMGTDIIEGPPGYLAAIARRCKRDGIHLIMDEVTTGFGRCGHLSLSAHLGVEPDMLLLGKGISSGYIPLSALVVAEPLYRAVYEVDPLDVFPHGSTTDGHPLGMAAGLAVLEILREENIYERVEQRGGYLHAALADMAARHPEIVDVRGRGLLIGVQLRPPAGTAAMPLLEAVRRACEDRGVLLNYTGECVTIVPPLVLSSRDCDNIVAVLDESLTSIQEQLAPAGAVSR